MDHENHDSTDCRKSNLREANNKLNTKHRKGKNSNNKSGYRNVCRQGNKWVVQLQVNGKNTKLGSFDLDQLEEAGRFAQEMREKYYGDYKGEN